jgi:hypothetical protein
MTVEHAGRTNGRVAPEPSATNVPADDAAPAGGGMVRLLLPLLLAAAAIFVIRRFTQNADA